MSFVLGVDPGTRKVGYAVVDQTGAAVMQGIEELGRFVERVHAIASERTLVAVALGRGTNAATIRASLETLGVPVRSVDERETTLQARRLYYQDHPPRGWRRLVPVGMQFPPRPIDDYAAVLIARRFLVERGLDGSAP